MSKRKLNGIRNNKKSAAIIFIHGFLGDPYATWGKFPQLIKSDFLLDSLDIYTLGYSTKLSPDIRGIWCCDSSIENLAFLLKTELETSPLNDYTELNIVAHSMGGLIAQQAFLINNNDYGKLKNLIMFGTPSNGLKKVIPVSWFKKQLADMDEKSRFITELRKQWKLKITDNPKFNLSVCGGDRDEFVPASSSLSPFSVDVRKIVYGNHIEIVKPENIDSLSYRIVQSSILGKKNDYSPYNLGSVLSEMAMFEKAIEKYEGKEEKLDEDSLVSYALALDGLGMREKAVEILEKYHRKRTDALGTLGGRFKRMWLNEGLEEYANKAYELYKTAFNISHAKNNLEQMYYHKINMAFIELVFQKDRKLAKDSAQQAKEICEKIIPPTLWEYATLGEASLHINPTEAVNFYKHAAEKNIKPWQVLSMFKQSAIICDEYGYDEIENKLYELFTGIK